MSLAMRDVFFYLFLRGSLREHFSAQVSNLRVCQKTAAEPCAVVFGSRLLPLFMPCTQQMPLKREASRAGHGQCSGTPNPHNLSLGLPKGWFPKGWFWQMFPRNENRNEGTFACSPGTKPGTRVRSPIPP